MAIDISNYKAQLEAHKQNLTKELGSVGQINSSNPADWEAVQSETEEDTADRSEVAESITEYESNTAILKQLETELFEVNGALDRIEKGTFGTCEVCGSEIEENRLNANPSARTCIEHIDAVL